MAKLEGPVCRSLREGHFCHLQGAFVGEALHHAGPKKKELVDSLVLCCPPQQFFASLNRLGNETRNPRNLGLMVQSSRAVRDQVEPGSNAGENLSHDYQSFLAPSNRHLS